MLDLACACADPPLLDHSTPSTMGAQRAADLPSKQCRIRSTDACQVKQKLLPQTCPLQWNGSSVGADNLCSPMAGQHLAALQSQGHQPSLLTDIRSRIY